MKRGCITSLAPVFLLVGCTQLNTVPVDGSISSDDSGSSSSGSPQQTGGSGAPVAPSGTGPGPTGTGGGAMGGAPANGGAGGVAGLPGSDAAAGDSGPASSSPGGTGAAGNTGTGGAGGTGSPSTGVSMPPPLCQSGDTLCMGDIPQSCVNGAWSPGPSCANGCAMGACCGDGTEAKVAACSACGAEGQPCCSVAKPPCSGTLTCDPTKSVCVVPCGPGQAKCCPKDTKVCSKNCGRTGMQVCDANGNWGNCSISDLPGCPGDSCGSQSCSGGTEKSPGKYDSKGKCSQSSHKCDGGLACNGNKCATSCDCGDSFTSCKGCPSGHYCGNDLKSCPAQGGPGAACSDPVECKSASCNENNMCD